jgi:RNA polymerase sigma factor (sigma-70 family)
MLLVITARKVMYRQRFDLQDRRDVRRNLENLIFSDSHDGLSGRVERLPGREPSPEFTAELQETYDSLVDGLDDPQAKQVVALRMEGYSDSEIAKQLDCSRRTVQRRVEIIRRHWRRLEASLNDVSE